MRQRYWVCIWSAILIFCIALSVSTRFSFSKLSFEEASNSFFYCRGNLDDRKQTDYRTLSGQSQLIVKCRFRGIRKLENLCCLSEVQVSEVIKGNQNFKGRKINIYEPVGVVKIDLSQYKGAPNLHKIETIFHLKGKRWALAAYVNADNCDGYFGYAMMAQNVDYLLFLNPEHHPADSKSDPVKGYVLADSPFSKLALSSQNAASFVPPLEYQTLKDTEKYEIMIRNTKDIQFYFDTKAKILQQIHLQS